MNLFSKRRRIWTSLWLMSNALNLLSCRTVSPNDSDTKYSVMRESREGLQRNSVLSMIDRGKGVLNITIDYKNFKQAPTSIQKKGLERQMTQAVTEWNKALRPSDGWKWPTVTVNYKEGRVDGNCKFSQEFWTCVHDSSLMLIVDKKTSRSNASMSGGVIVLNGSDLNPDDLARRDPEGMDIFLSRTLMHEYGHVIGLGDTYSEVGYQDPKKSPRAIMNSLFVVDTITDDDVAGVRALWAYMNGKDEICADDYARDRPKVNRLNYKFCLPKNVGQFPFQNPDTLYVLTTSFLGSDRPLGFSMNKNVLVAPERTSPKPYWNLKRQHGSEELKIMPADGKGNTCLEIDPKSYLPFLAPCGPSSTQTWVVSETEEGSGFYTLKTPNTGTKHCLDVYTEVMNNQSRDQVIMLECAGTTGQKWLFTPAPK